MKLLAKPQGIVVHHSATRDTESLSIDAITRFHKNVNGWDDIGYHFVVEEVFGEVKALTGRGIQYQGAHTIGKNDHIGICVVGNYDLAAPTHAHLACLTRLIAGILVLYPHLDGRNVHYHRDFSTKTCPGNKFALLDDLRDWVTHAFK